MQTKFIFITGGVVSGLGKGIASASIAALLESRGLSVSLTKLDPYINVDAGTMNPYQHGEVFVTEDGAETDLDLGHYERFTTVQLSQKNNCTTGQIYDAVLRKERAGEYLGRTVQVVPHIIDEIKSRIQQSAGAVDVAIIEIGGTVGDIESLPFLEAIRQFRHDLGRENTLFIHLTLIVYADNGKEPGEMKTKPTQHSVGKLREIGIQPDILICRTREPLPLEIKKKIALFTNVEAEAVINGMNVDSVYEVPMMFHQEGLDGQIVDYLRMWTGRPKLQAWVETIDCFKNPIDEVTIAFVGKYVEHRDSYESLNEALVHGGIAHQLRVKVRYINSEKLESDKLREYLTGVQGVLVAPGFGKRGAEGKIAAVEFARTQRVPFLGVCLGMQMAVVEFARNVAQIPQASSGEMTPAHATNVIDLMPDQEGVEGTGGTMRLGGYATELKKGTLIASIYHAETIQERHRHRYEVMNEFIPKLQEAGMTFSGRCAQRDLIETIELADHPWFIGCQYHPELKSKPLRPHPLFAAFIAAAYRYKQEAIAPGTTLEKESVT